MLQYFANHLAILQTDLHALEKHAFYDKYKIARSYCKILHCMKSVRIRSFYTPYLSVFSLNVGKYEPEKRRI